MLRVSSRLVAAGVVVAIALGAGAGTATASRLLGNDGGRGVESVWTPLAIRAPGGFAIICETRVEGIMNNNEDIRKQVGAEAGIVDEFISRECMSTLEAEAQVEALVRVGEPWRMRFQSFSGTLPRITEVLMRWEIAFLINVEPWSGCLFGGTVGVGTRGTTGMAHYLIETIYFQPMSIIPLVAQLRRGIVPCPEFVTLEAAFTGERVLVRVILIE